MTRLLLSAPLCPYIQLSSRFTCGPEIWIVPRPGTPGEFSAEQLAQIISVACESPEDAGRPVSHWTPRELAEEVIKRGIVKRISPRTVGRFLKRSRSQTASLDVLAQSPTGSRPGGV